MSHDKSKSKKTIRPHYRRHLRALLAFVLTLSLVGIGAIAMGWRGLSGLRSRSAANSQPGAAATNPPPGAPSREYIYAGSKLVAIEEGSGGSSLAAPASLEATGGAGVQVSIEWLATPGADHYQVERSASFPVNFTPVSSNVASNSFTDSPPDSSRAYLYRVRAADASGNLSPPSNIDLATTVAFTNDPLQQQTPTTTGTTIKADHLKELRQAVNAVRALVGLSPASWTHPDPEPAQRRNIYLADVTELRSNLDAALSILGIQQPYQTDPNLSGGYVKAAHFQELRERVK